MKLNNNMPSYNINANQNKVAFTGIRSTFTKPAQVLVKNTGYEASGLRGMPGRVIDMETVEADLFKALDIITGLPKKIFESEKSAGEIFQEFKDNVSTNLTNIKKSVTDPNVKTILNKNTSGTVSEISGKVEHGNVEIAILNDNKGVVLSHPASESEKVLHHIKADDINANVPETKLAAKLSETLRLFMSNLQETADNVAGHIKKEPDIPPSLGATATIKPPNVPPTPKVLKITQAEVDALYQKTILKKPAEMTEPIATTNVEQTIRPRRQEQQITQQRAI